MKTTVYVISSSSPNGGMEEAMLRLAAKLEGVPSEIWIVGPRCPDREAWERRAGVLAPGVPLRFLRWPHIEFLRPARGRSFVIVGLWTAIVVGPAARAGSSPVIFWEHSITAERLVFSPRFRVLAKIASIIYRGGDLVVAVSPVVRDGLGALGVSSRVIQNPPSLAMSHPLERTAPPSKTLACVGSLKRVKHVELAIEALGHLPEYRMLVAGSGPDLEYLRELASGLGLSERIAWLGQVEDPRSVYREASVVLHLSDSETYGYVLFEAAAHGVPVVVRDVPSLSRTVPNVVAGYVVPREATATDVAAAVHYLESEWRKLRVRPFDSNDTSLDEWRELGLRSEGGRS